MYAKIMIGDKEVELAANAATPIFYTDTFKKDFYKVTAPLFSGKSDPAENIGIITELAFIMAMSPHRGFKEMRALKFDDYVEWLTGFENIGIYNAMKDILDVYLGNNKTLSTQKKEEGQQTGRTQ